MSKLHISL